MVRWLPPPPPADGELPFGHDAVSLSFFVACVAATVALTSSMCSACGRKPKPATNADPAASSDQSAGPASVSGGSQDATGTVEVGEEEEEAVVRLSPELATHGAIDGVTLPKSASKRRLSISVSKKLSLKVPDKLRLASRREHHKEHHHKVESEDTLWKKGIILGEKCRIPGEREAECGTPVDPADEIAAESFRRSSYSRPVSRSSSFAMYQTTTPTPPQTPPQHDAAALHGSDS